MEQVVLEELQRRTAEGRVGTTLRGKWLLEELLGVGGMASVYRARHRNGAIVAVKMLHPLLGDSDDLRRRFVQEGYVANKIDHPAVVHAQDDDTDDDGVPFFVMELVEGETLAEKIRHHYFNDEELLEVAEQLCGVLAAAHSAGVIHRDLKPDNLIVDDAGKIHVLDFGIARLLEEGASSFATQTGICFGTPGFTAPEQALGRHREVGPATDLYALGATLFYLATGQFLHDAETPQELLVLVATQPSRSLLDLAPHISPEVAALVDRATRTAIEDRWTSAEMMLAAVRQIRRERTREVPVSEAPTLPPAEAPTTDRPILITVTQPEPPVRLFERRRSLVAVAAGFALLCAGSFAATRTPAKPSAHVPSAQVMAITREKAPDSAPVEHTHVFAVSPVTISVPSSAPSSHSKTKPSADSKKLLQKLASDM